MKTLNVIALLLFLAATGAVLTLKTPATQAVQAKVMSLFSPFIHASATMQNSTTRAIAPEINPKELQRDNERLRLEVQSLRIVNQRREEVLEENNKLRQLNGYKKRSPFNNLIPAHVIKRSAATWWNTMIIDKGSDDGITTDSPVVTDVGLVGKTGRVSNSLSEIVLLTDELCRVAAMVEGPDGQPTKEKGILTGERGGGEMKPDLRLRFLSRNAAIQPGYNVYSSGDGGVFPAKLLLGKVKRFENQEISGEAVVVPAVEFQVLEDVFVVDQRQQAAEQPKPAAEPKSAKK
ncbi:MAG: mreC [Verrucomicrobiaceae bacterium]|nr:mreC [Verrucomicrobiaceae bacterium]MDB6116409.1 mreC [Verrucomicrobiaceae bacterium]